MAAGYDWDGGCGEDLSQCDEDGFSLWNHNGGAMFFPEGARKKNHQQVFDDDIPNDPPEDLDEDFDYEAIIKPEDDDEPPF